MILCEHHNHDSFRYTLKKHAPEALALAIALYRLGMIEGLRGMLIAPCPPGLPRGRAVTPTLSMQAERRILDQHSGAARNDHSQSQ